MSMYSLSDKRDYDQWRASSNAGYWLDEFGRECLDVKMGSALKKEDAANGDEAVQE